MLDSKPAVVREKDTLVVIPARKGSKRLPGKNMLGFHGRPMVSYSVETGKKIRRAGSVVVASDDKEIGLLATEMEALWVPLPDHLTADDATLLPVLQYVLQEQKGWYEWIVLLQPNCPVRNPILVNTWANMAYSGIDSVISVDNSKYKLGYRSGEFFSPSYQLFTPKQASIPRMRENGVFYMFKSSQVMRGEIGSRILPVDTPTEQSLSNIDTWFDLDLASYFFTRYHYDAFFDKLEVTATDGTVQH